MSETHTLTIAGKSFTAAPRYAEGHVLTGNEANALNQTFFENLRNNFAGKAKEGGTQEDFDKYVETYKFGERTGGGGGSRDPIEVEAMALARDALKKTIQKQGKKLSDFTAQAISNAAKKLVDTRPEFREKAAQRVAEMQAVASDSISDDILAGLTEAPAATEEPAAENVAADESAEGSTKRGRRG